MILFCGDPHGKFDHIIRAVVELTPDAVVLLGDIQASRPLEVELAPVLGGTELFWIHGNHDTDTASTYAHLFDSALSDRSLDGRIIKIAGLAVSGLGGVFRGQIWMPPAQALYPSAASFIAQAGKGNLWRGGLPRRHRSTIFPDMWEALAQQRCDVLVMHEAPSSHPHGNTMLDELARRMGARRIFHGHHHADSRAMLGLIEVVGVGLRGIVDEKGRVIREGDVG